MVRAEAGDQEGAPLKGGYAMRNSIWKPMAVATLVCGTLDILFAMILTLMRGRHVPDMLRFVASGPFPEATQWGAAGALLGLLVHFTLMAIMVAVFVLLALRLRHNLDTPFRAGLAYGIVTYAVLDLIVVPLRFPAAWPPSALSITTQMFAHIVLVGLPTAYIAKRFLAPAEA
jgi:hypothetical protein